MNDCVFCEIANGALPCAKVWEDGDLLAFMDIGPIVKGHVLIVPKTHYESIEGIPDRLWEKLCLLAKRVAEAQRKTLGAEGVNLMQNNGTVAGQEVPHLHLHVIPRFSGDGHRWNWNPKSYASLDEAADLAKRLRTEIGSPA